MPIREGWASRQSPLKTTPVSFTAPNSSPVAAPPPIGTGNRDEILAHLLQQPRGPAPLSMGEAVVGGLSKGLEGWALGNKLSADEKKKKDSGTMMARILLGDKVAEGDPKFAQMATLLAGGDYAPSSELIEQRMGFGKPDPKWVDETIAGIGPGQRNNVTNEWNAFPAGSVDKPTPYTELAKAYSDFQNGLLDQAGYIARVEQINAAAEAEAAGGDGMFGGTSVEATALNYLVENNVLTPQQAAEVAAGKTITGPNGEIIFMTPSGIFSQASPDAPPTPLLPQQPQAPDNMLPAPPSPVGTDIFAQPQAMPNGQQSVPQPPQQPGQQPGARPGMIPLTDPKPAGPLSPATQKAILQADENIQAGQQVIASMERALEINDIAMSGPGAETQGYITSLWGDKAGVATEELKNIVLTQALSQLKLVFGALPTEGERKILIEIQGSVTQSPEVRRGIYQRAMEAAAKRMEFNRQRAEGLRSGAYFEPEYGLAGTDGADTDMPDEMQEIMEQAQEAIEAGADPEAVRQRLRERGVDDSFLGSLSNE